MSETPKFRCNKAQADLVFEAQRVRREFDDALRWLRSELDRLDYQEGPGRPVGAQIAKHGQDMAVAEAKLQAFRYAAASLFENPAMYEGLVDDTIEMDWTILD